MGKKARTRPRFCRSCGNRLGLGGEAEAPDTSLTSEQRGQRLLEEAFRLSEQGRVLAAIQTCQQALALTPNSTSAHSLLGTLYQRQGDRERAIREFEQVLTLSPESTVERRLLNELMGVPTASQPVLVSPRTARMAVTGAAAALVVVALAAFLLTRPLAAPRAPSSAPAATNRPSAAMIVGEGYSNGPPLPNPGNVSTPISLPAAGPGLPPARPAGRVCSGGASRPFHNPGHGG